MRQIDERLLTGEPVPEEPELTAVVAALRSMADAPAPLPTPALAQVLSEGLPADPPVSLNRYRRSRRSTLVKIALGAAVAAAAATGAAALEIPETLREPARSFFSGVADLFAPGESQPQPQPELQPELQPEPATEEPAEPAGDRPVDEKPPPDPADRPGEGTRPETPANPATPHPGRPEVIPGPPDDPGPRVDPGPPGDTVRDFGPQQPGENPYPDPGHRRSHR